MGLPIVTQGKVIDKSTSNGVNSRTGESVTYYNLKLFDVRENKFDNQLVGVHADVYNAVNVGDVIQLHGEFGGLKNKYWTFNGADALRKDKK